MKNITQSDKKDILIFTLEERYKALHIIRDRAQSVGIWALGLMVAASGWLMQNDVYISSRRKLLYILGLSLFFWALRFKYLEDLRKGFISQQKISVRIEEALGMYKSGVYGDLRGSLYPEAWRKAGSAKGDGNFFSTTYLLISIGMLILIVSIIICCDGTFNSTCSHRQGYNIWRSTLHR